VPAHKHSMRCSRQGVSERCGAPCLPGFEQGPCGAAPSDPQPGVIWSEIRVAPLRALGLEDRRQGGLEVHGDSRGPHVSVRAPTGPLPSSSLRIAALPSVLPPFGRAALRCDRHNWRAVSPPVCSDSAGSLYPAAHKLRMRPAAAFVNLQVKL
jgi:hypothetical protein